MRRKSFGERIFAPTVFQTDNETQRAGHLFASAFSPYGQRRCAALPPSLHILHIWEYNYRLFPKQTLFIIKTAFLSRQPPPPDCAATRRSPAGENRVLVPLTLPGQLAPLCAQAVRGMRLCVNRFSNGQRRWEPRNRVRWRASRSTPGGWDRMPWRHPDPGRVRCCG